MESASQIHAVVPGVWIWKVYDENARVNLYSTAVQAEEGLVLIDPVPLVPAGLRELDALGTVAAIVLTNGNHTRAAAAYRERFGASVLAHPDAFGELTIAVDGELGAGERVAGSLEVVELLGGGLGEVALAEPSSRVHFGDAVINLESTGFALLPDKYCVDPVRMRRGLSALLERFGAWEQADPEAGVLFTFAHGEPLSGYAFSKLRRVLEA